MSLMGEFSSESSMATSLGYMVAQNGAGVKAAFVGKEFAAIPHSIYQRIRNIPTCYFLNFPLGILRHSWYKHNHAGNNRNKAGNFRNYSLDKLRRFQ